MHDQQRRSGNGSGSKGQHRLCNPFILLSDIAGSSRMAEACPLEYAEALDRHNLLVEQAVADAGGAIYKNTGDGYFAFFDTAHQAISCAQTLALGFAAFEPLVEDAPFRVRIALHGGELRSSGPEYFGPALNRVSRICQICHPGQTLFSSVVRAAASELPDGAQLICLGEHYLRDLNEPTELYQLDDARLPVHEFPALETLNNRPHNLWRHADAFIGRQRELAELQDILMRGQRLISIVGMGGYGKSRLSRQLLADMLPQYTHGVYVVELEPLNSVDEIASAAARALKFNFFDKRPPEQQLVSFLRNKRMLICFDNFEHVLEGRVLVEAIIKGAPEVQVLITTREPLHLTGEQVYNLDALPIGNAPAHGGDLASARTEAGAPGSSDALLLFADRARQVNSSFALTPDNTADVAAICQALSGIPLAVELAAAWIDSFTLPELHTELEHQLELNARNADVPGRHHSLRASLDWSWNLLTEEQRERLMRMATFKGGAFAEAAEAVLGLSGIELRKALAALIDKSWLSTREEMAGATASWIGKSQALGQTRWFMRDSASREYALEKLEQTREGEDTLYESAVVAHARYYSQLVEREGPRLTGAGTPDGGATQRQALRCWQIELDNINEALAISLNRGEVDWLRPIAAHLSTYLETISAFTLSRERYHVLVEAARGLGDLSLQLRACIGLGVAHWRLGQLAEARVALREAQDLASQCGDRRVEAAALGSLGNVYYSQGDYARATELQSQSLAIQHEIGNRRGQASSHNNLGLVHYWQGDYPRASEQSSQALALYREMGDRQGEASALNNLGLVHFSQGDYASSAQLYSQALAICREVADLRGEANSLNNLGLVNYLGSDYARAADLYGQAVSIFREIGDRQAEASALNNLGLVYYWQGDIARAAELHSQAVPICHEIGDRRGEASALTNLGLVHYSQGGYARAAELFSQALAMRCEIKARVEIAVSCALAGACLAALGMLREAAPAICAASAYAVGLGHKFDPEDLAVINSGLARLDSAAASGEVSTEQLAAWKAEGEALSLDELAGFVQAALNEALEADNAQSTPAEA